MTIRDAQVRVVAYVQDLIHNGELTERGFARMIGISQPHIHNVLKGVRNLSIEIADSILNKLHLSILDLASTEDLEANLKRRKALEPVSEVPFLDTPIGAGLPWTNAIDRRKHFPSPFPNGTVPATWVMARISRDPKMDATLAYYDIAILDTAKRQLAEPSPEGLYAVERSGEVVLRYVRPGAHCYYLVTGAALENPAQWEQLNIPRSQLPAIIKARVLWLGRERDRNLPIAQRGRFLYEVISS